MIEGTLGFIGAGNMSGALIKGLLHSGSVTPDRIIEHRHSPRQHGCLDIGLLAHGDPAFQAWPHNYDVTRFRHRL